MMFRKKGLTIFVLILLTISGFFYFRYEVYYAHGSDRGRVAFEIKKGEGNEEIAQKLQEQKLISGKIYFYYYIRSHGLLNKLLPGEYELSGNMTIPEIAGRITRSQDMNLSVTFPEGFSVLDMAERLKSYSLDGDGFSKIAGNPENFISKYDFLKDEKNRKLEGYLFPDTYFFKKDESAESIISKMLNNFDNKLDDKMRQDIKNQGKSIHEIIVMASILEKEVKTSEDMKIVSGIFWRRIKNGQRLQSDATLSYFLNDTNPQHSGKDLEIDSPYNTYRFKGLPPGPIGNPGLAGIQAAINPTDSAYNYFLTVVVNGESKVIYSKTFEEHVANRRKYGI
jgi:UPF0755 protein